MTALSIVIPAFNEEDRIVDTLRRTTCYLTHQPFSAEVVVVSDGSSDGTVETVRRFSGDDRVRVVAMEYHPNRGKGFAVQYGMMRAAGRKILFMDADYSVPIQELEKGWSLLEQGAHIAIGSRAIEGSRVLSHQGKVRELSGKFYTMVQNLYLGIDYPDTQCGFKIFKREAARDLFGRQKLSSVIFDAEILWLAGQRGYRVAQFPVLWTHAEDSRIQYDSIGKFAFVFEELLRIKKLHAGDGSLH
ncbi:dolichyl-phosphate beta-glucosyltransferase [Thermodesulfobacteriota bacterium]